MYGFFRPRSLSAHALTHTLRLIKINVTWQAGLLQIAVNPVVNFVITGECELAVATAFGSDNNV